MLTDDPGTPGQGVWEVNLALVRRQNRDGAENELPLLDVNVGVGDRIQLKYEVAWIRQEPRGGESRSGLGDSRVGVKWRFIDAEWGAVIGRRVSGAREAMAELHAESTGDWARTSLAVNAGLRVAWQTRGVLLLSLGRELHAPRRERPAWLAYGGWQFAF